MSTVESLVRAGRRVSRGVEGEEFGARVRRMKGIVGSRTGRVGTGGELIVETCASCSRECDE